MLKCISLFAVVSVFLFCLKILDVLVLCALVDFSSGLSVFLPVIKTCMQLDSRSLPHLSTVTSLLSLDFNHLIAVFTRS